MFYIYLITNLINGKLYIGKTNNVRRRWRTHLTIAKEGKQKYPRAHSYIHSAISKYGEFNFKITTLASAKTEEDIFIMEREFIHQYKIDGYQLYNLTTGGDGASGYKHSVEDKLRCSSRQGGINSNWFGRKHSEETKREISISNSGERNSNAKLNWDKVNKIRELFSNGTSRKELSKKFEVAYTTICDICLNKIWKYRGESNSPNDPT